LHKRESVIPHAPVEEKGTFAARHSEYRGNCVGVKACKPCRRPHSDSLYQQADNAHSFLKPRFQPSEGAVRQIGICLATGVAPESLAALAASKKSELFAFRFASRADHIRTSTDNPIAAAGQIGVNRQQPE